jgi:poly-beta-1,6-N-acetyl-D-glucosamine synthase
MISIIITAYKEAESVKRAISNILKNNLKNFELFLVAPDKETLDAGKSIFKKINLVRDEGKGKPAALNKVMKKVKGEIVILSDGDVFVGEDSLNFLLAPFEDSRVGAVSGNPVSLNSRKKLFGYWAHVLTSVANQRRKESVKRKRSFFCSGYLFAIRRNLFPSLKKELLSEDGYISNFVYSKNFKIAYAEKARVFVKYPKNFRDWILQKKRSAGGYLQIKKLTGKNMRSFGKEASGIFSLFKYVGGIRSLFYLSLLIFARIYLWIVIYLDLNLRKKTGQDIWKRVESTK